MATAQFIPKSYVAEDAGLNRALIAGQLLKPGDLIMKIDSRDIARGNCGSFYETCLKNTGIDEPTCQKTALTRNIGLGIIEGPYAVEGCVSERTLEYIDSNFNRYLKAKNGPLLLNPLIEESVKGTMLETELKSYREKYQNHLNMAKIIEDQMSKMGMAMPGDNIQQKYLDPEHWITVSAIVEKLSMKQDGSTFIAPNIDYVACSHEKHNAQYTMTPSGSLILQATTDIEANELMYLECSGGSATEHCIVHGRDDPDKVDVVAIGFDIGDDDPLVLRDDGKNLDKTVKDLFKCEPQVLQGVESFSHDLAKKYEAIEGLVEGQPCIKHILDREKDLLRTCNKMTRSIIGAKSLERVVESHDASHAVPYAAGYSSPKN